MQDSRTFFHLTLRVGALHCWPSHYGHIEWTLAVRTFAVPDQSQTSLRAHLRPRGLMNTVLTTKKSRPGDHGGGVRGENLSTRSSLFEGRFGRMFRSLPPGVWGKDVL